MAFSSAISAFLVLALSTCVFSGPMRKNITGSGGPNVYSVLHQPNYLPNPRIPNSNSSFYRPNQRRNMLYVGATFREEEDDDEYEPDLIEEFNVGESNVLINRKIKPRGHFISEEDIDDVDVIMDSVTDYCLDDDIEYSIGETFVKSSDPCTHCRCTTRGAECNVTHCGEPPEGCIELQKDPGQCCPVCTRRGCPVGTDVYDIGVIFNITDCDLCLCKEDGRVDCSVADCKPPPCVDATFVRGECCPKCLNGKNCYGPNKVVIRAGSYVRVTSYPCVECKCRETEGVSLWLGAKQATCRRIEGCRERTRRRRHT